MGRESKDLNVLRHSTAHVMAQAVKHLFNGVKIAIGPAIESGFYYDFDYERPFTPEDLKKIEKEMQNIIEQDLPFVREEIDKKEAIKLFTELKEPYKLELLEDIDEDKVSIYRNGDFVDLCRGPHIDSTGQIKAFKLLSVAGAYWRGDEHNRQLQRIYGTSFYSKEELENHLKMIEEAKRRDHRKLGRELDLFSINDEAGAGLVIYHPKGALLRTIIEDFEKKAHLKRGYQIVIGPQILKVDLWKRSGHYETYREHMYFTKVDDVEYGIKPMNCLAHMLIYKSQIRSYKDLPIRYFELGRVLRHEKSGVLHGLARVREFTQDDAHILCRPDQLNEEIEGIIKFVQDVMGVFGFKYEMEVSTRPEKSIGSDEDWERATQALIQSLENNNLPYEINEGEGAFYGPKIDFKLTDALGRKWQCATIQCDFTMPERFDLTYIGKDDKKHRPVMLHRVILGSLERFIAVLIEHYAGAFPTWLSPVQVKVLTITDRQSEYGKKIFSLLEDSNIRVEADFRNEKLGFKIREAQLLKVPYMIILGDNEMVQQNITVRKRSGEQIKSININEFIKKLKEEVDISI